MSKILKIITHPNPILREKSELVKPKDISKGIYAEFLADMTATMLKKDGVGLAAPQVSISLRIIVIQYKNKIINLFNPIISKKSWSKNIGEEGCLSVPNVFGNVMRHTKIVCNYLDEKGEKQKIIASGMLARILQHECDHLDGVLFIDKIDETMVPLL